MTFLKPKPYVGITGFTTGKEVRTLGDYALTILPESHQLMLGYVVTDKRLADKSSRGTNSPAFNDLPDLIQAAPVGTLPMIHYFTSNPATLVDDLTTVFQTGDLFEKNLCTAVQLNQLWPELDYLEELKIKFSGLQIVLQLPKTALKESIEQIINKAIVYSGLAEYVLLDPSGGEGIDFRPRKILDLLERLPSVLPKATFGIAGGFSAENVSSHIELLSKNYHQPFSIDAQGKLRSDNKTYLDLEHAKDYLSNAGESFAKQNQIRKE
ncbi:MAG: hypothetical protein Q8Q01_02870 [archaeon]|nr:hypothetical protein [archaeon]